MILHEEAQFVLDHCLEKMEMTITHLEKELLHIRAGKSNPAMVDAVVVDYYGSMVPLSQVSNVSTPDPRTIMIQPWEKKMIPVIEKAIMAANLGFNPDNNGELIRISIPPLTAERRRDLVKVVKISPDVFEFWETPLTGFSNASAGPDTYSAWTAFRRGLGGFQGMGLPVSVLSIADYMDDEQAGKWIVFPDGLYSISRLLIRWLNPEALPGTTQEDSIHTYFNYDALDKPEKAVRIRLNSPVVQVRHVGDPSVALQVAVTYVNDGRAFKVKGAAVVMACFNAMIPYICPELPEEQKAALRLLVRQPHHMTTIALNNWRAHAKAHLSYVAFPTMAGLHEDFWGPRGGYEVPCLGVDQRVTDPDEPLIITAWSNWAASGLPPRESFRAGRAQHVELTEADYLKDLETKMQRVLGPYGFDADNDIEGMIVNRFGHGMAGGMNGLFDPEPPRPDQEQFVIGRKRFNLITIANSDASGVALTQAAIDQANRAVNEIVQDLVQPQPDFEFGSRV